MPRLTSWAARLRDIAREPLEFCPEFPRIAERWEAWWAGAVVDRPVFQGVGYSSPAGQPYREGRELSADLDAWFEHKIAGVIQGHRVGDELPHIRLDWTSPKRLATGKAVIKEGTEWDRPTIKDDWSNAPTFTVDEENPDLHLWREVVRRVARDANGRYLVAAVLPMGGDTLSGRRGTIAFALDVIDQPERIVSGIEAYYDYWHWHVSELYDIVTGEGAGLINWTLVWSNWPYAVSQCDFSVMISPRHLERIFLPEIARQAATLGRAEFHLDGGEMTRHIDALLSVPEIRAIQFKPSAHSPSALPWIEMYREIQRRGRSLQICCLCEDVVELCDALKPEGLALWVDALGGHSPSEADDLFAEFCRKYS